MCKSSGFTRWYFHGSNPHQEPRLLKTDSSLSIYPLDLNNGGIYSCYGTYNHSLKHFLATSTLRIYGKFYFLVQEILI